MSEVESFAQNGDSNSLFISGLVMYMLALPHLPPELASRLLDNSSKQPRVAIDLDSMEFFLGDGFVIPISDLNRLDSPDSSKTSKQFMSRKDFFRWVKAERGRILRENKSKMDPCCGSKSDTTGCCNENAKSTSKRDGFDYLKLAIGYLDKAGQQGHSMAQYLKGILEVEALGQYQTGLADLKKAAETGNRLALFDCARLLFTGVPSETPNIWHIQPDLSQALQFFKLAADAGDIDAMFWIGYILHSEKHPKAIEWLTKAADQGNHQAQHYLALAYLSADGTPADDKV